MMELRIGGGGLRPTSQAGKLFPTAGDRTKGELNTNMQISNNHIYMLIHHVSDTLSTLQKFT